MIQLCKLCGWPFDASGDPRDVFCGDCSAAPAADDVDAGELIVVPRTEKQPEDDDGDS